MEAPQSTRAVATLLLRLLARVLHQLHLVKCAALSYRYAKRGTCTFMIACFMLLVACRMSHSHRMSTCSRIACRTSQAHVACNSMIVVCICANGVRMVFEFIRMYRAHKHVTIYVDFPVLPIEIMTDGQTCRIAGCLLDNITLC